MTDGAETVQATRPFESRLESGKDRFLAYCIEHALETGRRTPEDFIRHFPPSAVMQGLAAQPKLRAGILVLTTGLKEAIAEKKSWESAAEDLQIALEEGETDAQSVVQLFHPDDRIRYLDATKIWQFLTEGDFWTVTLSDRAAHQVARDNVAFIVERALTDRLVTHREVVEGITVAELSSRLPKAELGRIIETALQKSKASAPFTEADLLSVMPPKVIVEHVPLSKIWSAIVEPLAGRHGYVAPPAPEPDAAQPVMTESASEVAPPQSKDDWIVVAESEAPPPPGDDVISDDDFAAP